MVARFGVLAVLLLASGCRKETAPHSQVTAPMIAASKPDSARDAAATPWLEAARQKAAGAGVLLVWRGASLVAQTPEGQVLAELPAVKSDVLDFDPVKDLLWVRDAERLLVFDLRSPVPRAELIATAPADLPGFVVFRTGQWDDDRGASSGECNDPYFTLSWNKTNPTTDAHDTSIVGTAWLAANWSRRRNKVPEPTGFEAEQSFETVRLPDTDGCDDSRVCGRAHPFGATHWMLVLAATDYSACRGNRCILFDPRTKKYSHPHGPYHWTAFKSADAGSCGPYRFNKSETWYATDDSICRTDGACQKVSGRVLDWTDPGPRAGSVD